MAAPSRPASLLRLLALLALAAALVVRASRPPAPVAASAPETVFSAERAMLHVKEVAQRPHPIGSADAARVRAYVLAELAALHVPTEMQEATGRRHALSGGWARPQPGRAPARDHARRTRRAAHGAHRRRSRRPRRGRRRLRRAVLLETLRALRAGPPLAARRHRALHRRRRSRPPRRRRVRRASIDGRRTSRRLSTSTRAARPGRVFMFETGAGDLDMVRFYRGAPNVNGTSLMVTVYRTPPQRHRSLRARDPRSPRAQLRLRRRRRSVSHDAGQRRAAQSGHASSTRASKRSRSRARSRTVRCRARDRRCGVLRFSGARTRALSARAAAFRLAVVSAVLVVFALLAIRRRERRWIRDLVLGVARNDRRGRTRRRRRLSRGARHDAHPLDAWAGRRR